ncbi:related to protein disulfide-isomerase precursor [Rhynchosporium agropyri]|uniref:Related to protein disulfide-isomerase n=1 Tax=Rhynchosporium agropyri TaxID=914238 RepID=A0A1E1LHM7_9HELO|nr:related to protein disulfide-isomerase precursor [Rhynchosporium agropyri]
MADAEPPMMSLQARIAALNQQSNSNPMIPSPTGKRPPPPPPPANRPNLPTRHTINNPPLPTYGSAVTKQVNNQPLGARGQVLLPPPPVDRDQPTTAKQPPPSLPVRNGPPPLPIRKASQPSPALPPRKSSTPLVPGTQMVRRGSNSSTLSHSSTVSGVSLGYGSSMTSVSSGENGRKLPPALGEAKLPSLPPTRRETEEKNRIAKERDNEEKSRVAEEKARQREEDARRTGKTNVRATPVVPVRPHQITAKSTPELPMRGNRLLEVPKLPSRPSGPPRIPSRSCSNGQVDDTPPQAARRLPPPSAATKSILQMGFGNKQKETPNPAPTPAPILPTSRPSPAVIELDEGNFHSAIKGKFALVKFYSQLCQNCTEIEPHYKELGRLFSFTSDRLIIAEVDAKKYPKLTYDYRFVIFPGIFLIDQQGKSEKYIYGRELEPLITFVEEGTGIKLSDATKTKTNGVPPPIKMSSKPTARDVQSVQSRVAGVPSGCLRCRDFSAPDEHSTKFPRHSLPRSHDLTGYLADVLCTPFPSATDKARVIFTWLHHNIAYDVDAFFGNRVKHVEPRDTITSGLAVCGGYAGVFSAIALKAGLEAVMVTGHGKGFGYSPTKPGEAPPPRDPSGHAWNAVRIDNGEWKLLDPCWGAGNVNGSVYNKDFTPSQFTMSNEAFGLKHFPQDDAYFFRKDRSIPTWEEYMLGPCGEEPLQVFSDGEGKNAIDITSFSPPQKRIKVNTNETIRFQFSKVCEHWDDNNNPLGKPYVFILSIKGQDGRKEDYVPFEKNEFWYWCDVKARDLGALGQTVGIFTVNFVEGRDARGLSTEEYMRKKGKVAMGPFGGICSWDLG